MAQVTIMMLLLNISVLSYTLSSIESILGVILYCRFKLCFVWCGVIDYHHLILAKKNAMAAVIVCVPHLAPNDNLTSCDFQFLRRSVYDIDDVTGFAVHVAVKGADGKIIYPQITSHLCPIDTSGKHFF
jgi:hypothetical protein